MVQNRLVSGSWLLLAIMLLAPHPVLMSQRTGDYLSRVGSFAQVVSGGGWKTQITLINRSVSVVTGQISFYSDGGDSLILPLVLPQSNSRTTSSVVGVSIAPNGTFVVESEAATSSVAVGWADIQASDLLSGFAIFRFRRTGVADSEGTALIVSPAASFVLPYDNTDGSQTGVALANPDSAAATLSLAIRDDNGTQLTSSQIIVPAMGHVSFFINNRFPQSMNRRGIVEFRNTSTTVAGMGLRFSPSSTFTLLPILP